ncbi:TRAP transporter large permease [Thermoanaerobacterium sp. DL9XJH110]|uniref:TRAP transporter large permease n=1 Tax=Thermoanaerobacterium sp. DL9XJH110 TaxID=3386643 RepID=UPI003BB4D048
MGIPISFSLTLASIVSVIFGTNVPLMIGPQMMFKGVNSFPIMAIPFFLLAGNIMSRGGISKRLIRFAYSIVGAITGGLGTVSILASMFFAAISGSSPATAAAIGSIMIPSMEEKGYDRKYSAAVIAAAGTIGVVIPPSIPMVVYGVNAGVSIGGLFLGGIIPGILMGLILIAQNYYYSKKNGYLGEGKFRVGEFIASFIDSIFALLMPVIILGGIYSGVFTPTESAVIASAYGLIVGMLVYRELKLKDIPEILAESAKGTSKILVLIAAAMFFGWFLASQQIPQRISATVLSYTTNPYLILLFFNIILLIAGTFLDSTASIVLLTPIFLPIMQQLNINPLLMGIVMTVNLAIGQITPPVGLNLFVTCGIAKIKFDDIIRPIVPFILGLVFVVLLITYIPSLSLYLPTMFNFK